jgi:hypothetical protein
MLGNSDYIEVTEAHVPLAQGREGIPPFSFPTGLCNDALPPVVALMKAKTGTWYAAKRLFLKLYSQHGVGKEASEISAWLRGKENEGQRRRITAGTVRSHFTLSHPLFR